MTGTSFNSSRPLYVALAAGIGVTLCWFLLTWRYGLDLSDEGYYWYGAQRTLRGEVPIRDFLAYDIGRYLWAAGVMALLGDDGIFSARLAAILYQALTVSVGVFLALQARGTTPGTARTSLFAVVVALLLNLWATPYYKVFDYGTSILVVAMLVMIMRSLSPARWFGAGLILGFAAVMGRNHGVYGAAAALLVLGFLLVKGKQPRACLRPAIAFIGGTIAGFSPTFLMGLAQPGFMDAFVAGVIEHVHSTTTATNIPLPFPWPWTRSLARDGWLLWGNDVFKSLGFVALLLVPALTLLALARKRLGDFTPLHALLAASACAGLTYTHYAYSRADVVHLALAIVPLLLVLIGCGMLVRRVLPMAIALLGVSVLAVAQDSAVLNGTLMGRPMTTVSIDGSTLHVYPYIEDSLRDSATALAAVPGARQNFLALPDMPGLFAIHRSRIGIWEIYALSARSATFEQAELARLGRKPPQLVLLSNHALDDHPELTYSRMHPVMYKWVLDNYRRANLSHPGGLEVYIPKAYVQAQGAERL